MTRTLTAAGISILMGLGLVAQSPMSQYYRPAGYQATFLITQNAKSIAPTTDDQLTIVFATRSVEGPRPPRPFFGEDIVQEFSFSGNDFVQNQLRFTRRVNDKSFLDARYIRVFNYGGNGWDGESISLTVDGQEILRNVRMMPHIGGDPSKGFQHFNPRDWASRSYWEADLTKFKSYAK